MKLLNDMFIVAESDGEKVRMRLNIEHPIYKAHFPGNPITPGVCIVQVIGELLSMRVGEPLRLSRIVNLKFVSPLSPVENSEMEVSFSSIDENGGAWRTKGIITANGEVKTKFSMVYE